MRKVLVLIVAVVAGLTLAGAAWIAVGVSPRFPERASNGVDYILYTDVPSACTRRSPCPVIYLLDGERWFSSTRDALHGLVGARRAPPVVLVGIGYQNIARTAALRKRDFTPDFGGASGATGGADAYLRVLRDELMPYAERTMPIDPSRRVLAGHSYAGLFATHALIEAPDLFEATVIVSPALWFGDYATFERNLPATRQRIFLAADTPADGESAMARDVRRLASALLQRGAPRVSVRIFAGKTHDTVTPPALEEGFAEVLTP